VGREGSLQRDRCPKIYTSPQGPTGSSQDVYKGTHCIAGQRCDIRPSRTLVPRVLNIYTEDERIAFHS